LELEALSVGVPPLPHDWVQQRVAVLLSPALGDSLVTMIIANNLARAGACVTVFGSQTMALHDWFAHQTGLTLAPAIESGNGVTEPASRAAIQAALAVFDVVVQLHHQKPVPDLASAHRCAVVLEPVFDVRGDAAMVDRMQAVARTLFGCVDATRDNGLQAPRGLQSRRHARRVAIHPMASTADKCWLPERFLVLATRLRGAGFDPHMILASHERAAWAPRLARAGIPVADVDSLSALASWIYESGWFIGNDSGIGHLASNLGVPTLSLFMRKGIARTWRPSWGSGHVLIGSQGIPTGKLKERFWKHALTVNRVWQAFAALRAQTADGRDGASLKRVPVRPRSEAAGVDAVPHGGVARAAAAGFDVAMANSATVAAGLSPQAGAVAISMSGAIGDTLVMMVVVRNLMRHRIPVTVFGRTAHALRTLFPDVDIVLPPEDEEACIEALRDYPTVLQMHDHQPIPRLTEHLPQARTLREVEYSKHGACMAERFAAYAQATFDLAHASIDNGLTPPVNKRYRLHRMRVVIHPEATTDDKRWGNDRFVRLAALLRKKGYEPHFVIAPHERTRWPGLAASGIPAPHFANLQVLAEWIYESGWFIGNDSGIGHLASNLGIPTLSLFRRRGSAQRWRPAWGRGQVALGWQWLPGASMKERYWRETLHCRRVMRQFLAMVENDG